LEVLSPEYCWCNYSIVFRLENIIHREPMPESKIAKTYDPSAIEDRIYRNWEERGYFVAPIVPGHKPFVILIPPPNVTGMLTMGHVLNNTLQDILIRWHRMQREDTLWLPGTDHAGIATQIKVEATLLAEEGKTRHDLGREALLKRIWKWRDEYGGIIFQQLRKLGASCDWSRERFTLDEGLARAVREIFVRLYRKGLIYRGRRIVNWDPDSQTALSDEQVEYREVDSHLWYMKYPLVKGDSHVTVATTRPETMLGDTAVAVSPRDERYRSLVGQKVKLPLCDRAIPIIADDLVDPEFGTGAVKVTPAHDPNDFDIGERHHLEFVSVIGKDGRMTEGVPARYRGMTREECRKAVVADLQEQGLIEKIVPYRHAVGHNERTGTAIEPLLSEQWFVKMKPLAEPAMEAVRSGKVRFHPAHWEKTYFHWLENVRDWCISRQIWWGHRIPIWTCKDCGEVIVATDAPDRCPTCFSERLEQDPDVLDTWFSSWLWPFSTLGWPAETEDLRHFFPTDVLITGPDIIFLWVARMIMSSLEVMGEVPFEDVYFTGMVRDIRGRKMSKSLGNSPDPLAVIADFGADAMRFTIVSLTPRAGDILYENTLCEMGRNFANKIWNATRFILMNLEQAKDFEFAPIETWKKLPTNIVDRWIVSAFFSTVQETRRALEEFRFSDAAKTLYAFFWGQQCDWYIELCKTRLANATPEERGHILSTALAVLDGSLRLLHPFMPFITEEIWQTLRSLSAKVWPTEYQSETIMLAPYPVLRPELIDRSVEEEFAVFEAVVSALRNIRGELGVKPDVKIKPVIVGITGERRIFIENLMGFITDLSRAEKIIFVNEKPKGSASAVVEDFEIFVPLGGLIDVNAEKKRLAKEKDRLSKLAASARQKLVDEKFLARAPAEVVEREREKSQEIEAALRKVERHYEEICSLTEEG
jgi:valyl-tRNA synthetase